MFPHSKRYELHLHSPEAFQRWPPIEMTCFIGTLIMLIITTASCHNNKVVQNANVVIEESPVIP